MSKENFSKGMRVIQPQMDSKTRIDVESVVSVAKSVTEVAAEFLLSKNSYGTIILKTNDDGEIDPEIYNALYSFLTRNYGKITCKPTAEGMELSWK